MPEIYVDYDLPAIFKGKVHLEEMRLNMNEFVVVKNEKGELNLDALKVVQAQKEGKKPEAKAKEGGKIPEIQIDTLKLKVGKVVYKDYSGGGNPTVREFKVNLDEELANLILFEQAYSAAARIVSVIQRMFDALERIF